MIIRKKKDTHAVNAYSRQEERYSNDPPLMRNVGAGRSPLAAAGGGSQWQAVGGGAAGVRGGVRRRLLGATGGWVGLTPSVL